MPEKTISAYTVALVPPFKGKKKTFPAGTKLVLYDKKDKIYRVLGKRGGHLGFVKRKKGKLLWSSSIWILRW